MAAATVTLCKRTIEALKPRASAYDVFDARLRGYAVRVHPSGRKSYRFKYVFAGRQRVITIGEHGAPWTAETARTQAQVLRGEVAAGADPAAGAAEEKARATAPCLTVAQLIEMWLREGRAAAPNKRASSWAHDASRLRRHILPLIGAKLATTLKAADIEAAQTDIAAGATATDVKTARGRAIVRGGPAAARGAIVSLSACLSWAAAHDIISTNPAAKVKKIVAAKRERFLSEAETLRLLDALASMQSAGALAPAFADALRMLLLTGARKAEILKLSWREVDLERGVIVLPAARAKSGARSGGKTIALSAPAIELLAARPRDGRYVFPSPRDPSKPIVGLQKIWRRVLMRAGLDDVRVHDCRHSFASFAAADGANLVTIAKALGHTQVSTTQRYTHIHDAALKQLADRVGARIMSRPAPPPASANVPPSISARQGAERIVRHQIEFGRRHKPALQHVEPHRRREVGASQASHRARRVRLDAERCDAMLEAGARGFEARIDIGVFLLPLLKGEPRRPPEPRTALASSLSMPLTSAARARRA